MQTDYRMMMAIRTDHIRHSVDRSAARSQSKRTNSAFGSAVGSSGGWVRRQWAYAATAGVIVAIASSIDF